MNKLKRCPSCGGIVPRGRGFKSDRRYCNYACYRDKTPKMVELEEQFGKPLKEVILEYLNENDNLTVTAEPSINMGEFTKELEKAIKREKLGED